jgi:hypothetical protein
VRAGVLGELQQAAQRAMGPMFAEGGKIVGWARAHVWRSNSLRSGGQNVLDCRSALHQERRDAGNLARKFGKAAGDCKSGAIGAAVLSRRERASPLAPGGVWDKSEKNGGACILAR